MNQPVKYLLIALAVGLGLVSASLLIKFNATDTPYQNESVTYTAPNGEILSIDFKADGSVEIKHQGRREINLQPILSGSGARYSNSSESVTFWTKGDEAVLIENGQLSFKGYLENNPTNRLANSIWSYHYTQQPNKTKTESSASSLILTFGNQQFFAETHCHLAFGEYQYLNNEPTNIRLSNITTNQLPCEPAQIAAEQPLISILNQIHRIDYQEEELMLSDTDNNRLHFKLFGLSPK